MKSTAPKIFFSSKRSVISTLLLSILILYYIVDHEINSLFSPLISIAQSAQSFPKKVMSGWDTSGINLYRSKVISLSKSGYTTTSIYPPGLTRPFVVANVDAEFWNRAKKGKWERQTFFIFNRFINPGVTTVVDFGTWIGPTLFYHGQFSKRSFGIEADPDAFAVVEYNAELNRKFNPEWGRRITIDSGCISRPEDAGKMTMKAAGAGRSMSGIGKKVYHFRANVKWEVQCYALPDIFENYWGIEKPYEDVFIKIDVESYECKLIPSFYEWLKEEKYLPKMFIAFHPQIDKCSDEDFEGIHKFLKLYDYVTKDGDQQDTNFKEATLEELKVILDSSVMVYQEHHRVERREPKEF